MCSLVVPTVLSYGITNHFVKAGLTGLVSFTAVGAVRIPVAYRSKKYLKSIESLANLNTTQGSTNLFVPYIPVLYIVV